MSNDIPRVMHALPLLRGTISKVVSAKPTNLFRHTTGTPREAQSEIHEKKTVVMSSQKLEAKMRAAEENTRNVAFCLMAVFLRLPYTTSPFSDFSIQYTAVSMIARPPR